MIQLNYYKKKCQLTNSEVDKICNFFKDLFKVDSMTEIRLYMEDGSTFCEIDGLSEPKSAVVGSCVQHDREIRE